MGVHIFKKPTNRSIALPKPENEQQLLLKNKLANYTQFPSATYSMKQLAYFYTFFHLNCKPWGDGVVFIDRAHPPL